MTTGAITRNPSLPLTAGTFVNELALTSNGTEYALFYIERANGDVRGKLALFDRSGTLLASPATVAVTSKELYQPAIVVTGDAFFLAWVDGLDGQLHARSLTPAEIRRGNVQAFPSVPGEPKPPVMAMAMASDGERALVVWSLNDNRLLMRVLDAGANPVSPIADTAWPIHGAKPSVTWDGRQFIVADGDIADGVAVTRISRDGQPLRP